MYESLDLFRVSSALARHAGARQALASANVANADTPGYQARTLAPFSETFEAASLRATRPAHLRGAGSPPDRPIGTPAETSPNGNAVSLESEMFASAEAARDHGRALAVWRHALGVLRTSLGR